MCRDRVPGRQGRAPVIGSRRCPVPDGTAVLGTAGRRACDDEPVITQVDARDARPGERGAVRLAASVAAAALSLSAATIVLDVLDAGVAIPPGAQIDRGWLAALTGLAQALPGALLLRRMPRHAVA